MSKLAIIGTIEAVPGRRDELLNLLMAHRDRCLKDEPGTVQFDIMVSEEDETKVLLYEVYADAAAFEVHRSAPSIAQWRRETAGMVAHLHVTIGTLVS